MVKLREKLALTIAPRDIEERMATIPTAVNEFGYDEWGMNPEVLQRSLFLAKWFYEKYFRVELTGIENVPEGRVFLIANHSGQLPYDAVMIFYAMFMHGQPPRIIRSMVERYLPRMPFVNTWFVRCGQITGDPINCRKMLEKEQALLVFPEGAKGLGKTYWHRYQLQKFGTGFMRLALETETPIVPVTVIGAEEIMLSVYNAKRLARFLRLPYFPVTPLWPLLGPLGMVPAPSKIHIYFGQPMRFQGDFDGPEAEIAEKVQEVKSRMQEMIQLGLEQRQRIF